MKKKKPNIELVPFYKSTIYAKKKPIQVETGKELLDRLIRKMIDRGIWSLDSFRDCA